MASDTSSIQKTVDSFVADYNSLMSFIDQQTAFDPSTKTAGPLLGDTKITDIQDQLQNMVQNIVPGAKAGINYLGALGITLDGTGQLRVDDTKLGNVLNGSVAGVSLTDIRKLFSMSGTSPIRACNSSRVRIRPMPRPLRIASISRRRRHRLPLQPPMRLPAAS